LTLSCLAFLLAAAPAAAAEADRAGTEFFEKRIRPILVEHCYECHSAGAKTLRGGLRLDSRDLIRQGGDTGAAIVPGNVDESLLIGALRYESYEMPPQGKLPDEVIADFVKWVEMGAPDPREAPAQPLAGQGMDIESGRQFWSFRPPANHTVPQPNDGAWARNDIDRFILSRVEAEGLQPGRDADKRTLVRRVYFDLIGLPPPPDEIDAFLADDAAGAFERLVDRLLDSPRFGERWGRHWLDVARYADSTGGGRSLLYGEAWRYRDYVIDAFNRDKPYDRFVLEQIAGDLLPFDDYRQGQQQLTGVAFLVLGPTNYEEQDKEQLRMDVIDEQIDTVGRAFLGLTIGCARCHDHKFDPIPTTDYYALAGIFRSTQTLIHDNVSTWVKQPLPVDPQTQQHIDEHTQALAALQARVTALDAELKQHRSGLPIVTLDDDQAKFTGTWGASSGVKEYVGTGYRYAGGGAHDAVYEFALKHAGRYEVRVAHNAHTNRSPNARVIVKHADGEAEHRIDQTQPPPIDGLYTALGQYEFGRTATVTLTTRETEGNVIADAVQLVPQFRVEGETSGGRIVADASTLPGVVVDNTAAELEGAWMQSVYTKSFVGAGYIHDQREGKGGKRATFRTDLPQSGDYEVRLSYTHADSRAAKVPVHVTHIEGETTVHVNQRKEPGVDGLFASLGRFRFNNDQTAIVTVSTEGTEDGYVIVDALQFVSVADLDTIAKAATETSTTRDDETAALTVGDTLARIDALERDLSNLKSQISNLQKHAPAAPPAVLAVKDDEKDRGDYRVCIRGNVHNLGDVVPRGFLTVATSGDAPQVPPDASGRLQLAQWVASADNPLTARVMVNRLWHNLLGAGLVRTVDNFGVPGERPSHPELLDHLALRFIDHGWSVKRMIREIVLSRTYQLSSDRIPAQDAVDPENRLLARHNRRRLDAEAIYDSILALSGRLDLTPGGNTVRADTKSEYGYQFDDARRAAYLPVFRNRLHDLCAVFDFPDPNLSIGGRTTTTLSTQALFLMNSPFVLQQARFAAQRILAEETDQRGRVELLYAQALSRPPADAERRLAAAYIADAETADPKLRLARWTGLCQAVMGCIDFRYTD
jgi:mono/diheme cytochrome c family protein